MTPEHSEVLDAVVDKMLPVLARLCNEPGCLHPALKGDTKCAECRRAWSEHYADEARQEEQEGKHDDR